MSTAIFRGAAAILAVMIAGSAFEVMAHDKAHVHENGSNTAHRHTHGASPQATGLPKDIRTLEIEGYDFRFEPADLEVVPGEVFRLKLVNKGQLPHMWEIEGRPETHVHAEVGETAVGVITAPDRAGQYRTVCTAEGHTEAGMVGKLVVREIADRSR
ncbi:MAG: cupredoxin domain-containing protein [Planctomycetaceae bacterium]|nr:cupredoxin domain-containing protein [Planctomycetaceae bacterium]